MAKGATNKNERVEIWLSTSDLRHIAKHMTQEKESRKSAIERLVKSTVDKSKLRVAAKLFN